MTAEEALADMRAEVANPPWCYVDDGVPFEYIPVEFVNRWIDALTSPTVELPTSEGWWWEWNQGWRHVREISFQDGDWRYWDDGDWTVCNPGCWAPCTPPPAPAEPAMKTTEQITREQLEAIREEAAKREPPTDDRSPRRVQ